MNTDSPAILSGVFDRRNFGDLLLAQVTGRLLAEASHHSLRSPHLSGFAGCQRTQGFAPDATGAR